MNKERIVNKARDEKARISEFIHVREIIPGVLKDIEKRIKESHKNKKHRR